MPQGRDTGYWLSQNIRKTVNVKQPALSSPSKVSEYDQEMLQSHTPNQPHVISSRNSFNIVSLIYIRIKGEAGAFKHV